MTRHDLRVALILAGLVVVFGLFIGVMAGLLTRGDPVDYAAPDGPHGSFAAPTDAVPQAGQGLPGWTDLYVNDWQDLLDDAAEARVRSKLVDLYDLTGIEMTLVTLQNVAMFGTHQELEPFATALFNHWGVGNAARNDGVMILIAQSDRRMRIEIGAGYDVSWNDRMQRVIDVGFLPSFRADEYQGGIERGVDETIRELTGAYPGENEIGLVRRGWSWIWRQLQRLGEWVVALALVPVAAIALFLRRWLRNRPRLCQSCGTLMLRAGEEADDEHLDGGQRLEEFLKSVDYDVWYCPDCGDMQINRYKNWFSSYGACRECGYKTLESHSTVLTEATKTSTGLKRVDYDCRHCGAEYSETRTIPKVSSSSSGSGRSSFGGGSSSGGGASGSW